MDGGPVVVLGAGGQPVKVGMRFSTPAGYTLTGAPRKPVGALFYDAYRSALSRWTYAGPEPVRVLGHSLGAQLTLALAEQAYADPALPPRQRPARDCWQRRTRCWPRSAIPASC